MPRVKKTGVRKYKGKQTNKINQELYRFLGLKLHVPLCVILDFIIFISKLFDT